MKLFEIVSTLSFSQDNPGGMWLKNKREDNQYHVKARGGAPRTFGPVTGRFNRPVLLPVSLLKTIRGENNEQDNVREQDLAWLIKYMSEHNTLPVENGKQYPPFIVVDQEGNPWVSEGNHRIMAADKLGWVYLPVEIRYYTGGEDTADSFAPSKLKSYDSKAVSQGYASGNNFVGVPKDE